MYESAMKWQHGQTWYRVLGDLHNGRTPVILLHGGPGVGHNYLEAAADLIVQSGRACVLYDQLGCGNSTLIPDAPKEFWTPELFMEELSLLTKELGIQDDYALLGQSWGGMLGMQYAIGRPSGLTAIVIADSPSSMAVWVSEANKLRAMLPPENQALLLKHETEGTTDDPAYEEAMEIFYSRHVCRVPMPPSVVASFALLKVDPTVYYTMNGPSEFHTIGSLKTWDITDQLSQINVPTLLVSGQHDEATPFMVAEIHKRIPGSVWHLFTESSHMPHIEEPALFKRIVCDFLDSVTA